MSIKAGSGFSNDPIAKKAGEEAAAIALEGLDSPKLLIVFSSVKYDQKEMLSGVESRAKGAKIIGCSDAGEITNGGTKKEGVAVMAIESDSIDFITGTGGKIEGRMREAGIQLSKEITSKCKKEELKAIITLTDVLKGNGAEVVRGIQDYMGKDFLIVGGAAGDDFLFKETFVYYENEVISSSLVGFGILGEAELGVGVRHGWIPIGRPMKVTKSEGAVLKEVDGKPAISIYEDYFGSKADKLREEPLARMAITYPLGMSMEESDELLLRDAITVNDDGSIVCAAEIPEGSEVRLMIGSQEEAILAAEDAAKKALSQLALKNKIPKAALIFNCIARNKLFGRDASKEIEAIKAVLGKDVPIIGFYTYGEQAPIGGNMELSFSCFHNETAVILLIG
jgi:hypothetical protein